MLRLALIVVAVTHSFGALAAVPSFIPYSGRLTDGTAAGQSTTLDLTLTLYNAATDGGVIFRGLHPDVPVVDGYFSVFLGTCNAAGSCDANPANATFPATLPAQLWLGVAVNAGTELSPRQPIGSVPYAVTSGNAGAVGGTSLSGLDERFVNANGDDLVGGFTLTGALSIVPTTTSDVILQVESDSHTASSGLVYVVQKGATNSPTMVVKQVGAGGNNYVPQGLVVDVDGAGTGKGMALEVKGQGTDRLVVLNGGNVGIGTASPQSTLDVSGNARVSGEFNAGPNTLSVADGKTYIGAVDSYANGTVRLQVNGAIRLNPWSSLHAVIGMFDNSDGVKRSCAATCANVNGACLGAWNSSKNVITCADESGLNNTCLCALQIK